MQTQESTTAEREIKKPLPVKAAARCVVPFVLRLYGVLMR